MLRVALFFDGKNHMKDLRRTNGNRWLDHGALAAWMVEHVGGDLLHGAYYYTGVPQGSEEHRERTSLTDLLDELERRPGFFVKRYARRPTSRECPNCAEHIGYTEEKMVDTALVTDLVMLAVQDAYDIAVVFSGDLDIAPGLEAVRTLGKRANIATFGTQGLSKSLSRYAWSHIDLSAHIESFSFEDLGEISNGPAPLPIVTPTDVDSEMLRELRRAEAHFAAGGGFVGAHYFIHRWKGHSIPDAPEERRASLQRLMQDSLVEAYAVDGKTALKSQAVIVPPDDSTDPSVQQGPDDDEQTMEVRVPETVRRLGRRRRSTDDA